MKKVWGKLVVGLVLVLGLVCYGGLVQAATLNVCKSGCTYSKIQDAIDAANTGDMVLVDDGVYMENINFNGLAISVQSVNGAEYTTIDGNASGSVVAFASSEGSDSVLDGFSITNGSGTPWEYEGNIYLIGGGIFCNDSSSPTITNCIISDNSAYFGGGIECLNSSSPTIADCTIKSNTGAGISCGLFSSPTITNCAIINNMSPHSDGGGIECEYYSSPTITNCTISGNRTDYEGGGIRCRDNSSPIIINCTISGNTAAEEGGGIRCEVNSSPTITNCTISGNTASLGGGGIWSSTTTSPTVVISIFWGNYPNEIDGSGSITITYSDIQGGWAGTGNINTDPLFVGSGDYHLTAGSPCIDRGTNAGAPAYDIDYDCRPYDVPAKPNNPSAYDMGSDEFISVSQEPYLCICTDKPSYTTGETMDVRLKIIAGTDPTVADVYIRIVFPGGAPIYYYPTWSETPTPVVSFWTVTDWGPAVFFSYTFNGTEAPGTYKWQAGFTEPGTYNIIGEASSAPFIFSP